jgi:hypothetical protein
MLAMIVTEDAALRGQVAGLLADRGADILSFGRLDPAVLAARRAAPDVLVLAEHVGGRLSHALALLAEWRNPDLALVLLSDRHGDEAAELFELLPALRALLPPGTDARTLARLALSSGQRDAAEEAVPFLRAAAGASPGPAPRPARRLHLA